MENCFFSVIRLVFKGYKGYKEFKVYKELFKLLILFILLYYACNHITDR